VDAGPASASRKLRAVPVRAASDPTEPNRTGVQAIERAIAILQCFTGDTGDRGISDLAAEVHLGASTVHRIVRALCEGGYLAQDPASERYHLGPTTVLLGQLASERLGLSLARDELVALVRGGAGRGGAARAAVAVQGPTVRMAPERTGELASAAVATASRIAGIVPPEC
jgi:DNA-binding IclR family transcriptional regulator